MAGMDGAKRGEHASGTEEAGLDHLLTIREAAEWMGMSPATLRSLARQGLLPAEKHAGRWLVQAGALDGIEVRRSRARQAEATSLDDLTDRLLGRGSVVGKRPSGSLASPAQVAESAAIEAQLSPGAVAERPLAMPAGRRGRVRQAQREALEHLRERLEEPEVPERSL